MQQITLSLVIFDPTAPGEQEPRIARFVERVWAPLVDALAEHAHVRVALHLSGAVGDWMGSNAPWILDRLAELVGRDQVEVLGGSPVGAALQSLPERDAVGHIHGASRWAQERLGATVRGAWLGVGGWDPIVPRLLARAGIRYSFVEDALLRAAGADPSGEDAWFVAEREGAGVGVMRLDSRLAALVPWALPRYFAYELKQRAAAEQRYVAVAISGENLGLRSGSRNWCWGSDHGWVPSLMRLLRAQGSWLKTALPGQVVDTQRPGGRVAPGAAAWRTGGAAGLPATMGRRWRQLQRDQADAVDPAMERYAPWLCGPPWEAFLVRRDEANRLHKRMLRASATVQRLRRYNRNHATPATVAALEQARAWLYTGQGGAPLHGSHAGGPDRPDLRHTAWRALMRAEFIALQALGDHHKLRHEVQDHDCDGQREILVQTRDYSAMVRPALGGAISELGLWGVGNLVNSLRRREETWHEGVAFALTLPALVDPANAGSPHLISGEDDDIVDDEPTDDNDTIATIHTDRLQHVTLPVAPPLPVPSRPAPDMLACDRHERLLFQDHFLGPGTTLDNLRRDQHPEQGDFVDEPYGLLSSERIDGNELQIALAREGVVDVDGVTRLVRVYKRYVLRRDSPVIDIGYEIANRYREPVRSRFATELNLGLDGRVEGRFLQSGDRRAFLDSAGQWDDVTDVALVFPDRRLRVHMWSAEPCRLYFFPVDSLVETCEGYEAHHQGICLFFAWDLHLWGEERQRYDLFFTVEKVEEEPDASAG
ncbi:MAG: DUF1926 domain-containing protein [Deltaproteobacteria bacterium]|nr:MAG: DUF1926 domain-containing protein [Deltaproteobacteria bacterium]